MHLAKHNCINLPVIVLSPLMILSVTLSSFTATAVSKWHNVISNLGNHMNLVTIAIISKIIMSWINYLDSLGVSQKIAKA